MPPTADVTATGPAPGRHAEHLRAAARSASLTARACGLAVDPKSDMINDDPDESIHPLRALMLALGLPALYGYPGGGAYYSSLRDLHDSLSGVMPWRAGALYDPLWSFLRGASGDGALVPTHLLPWFRAGEALAADLREVDR